MAPKPYEFIWFGDIYGPKPYECIGFGDIYGPKPYEFIGFGSIRGPKPYEFIGFGSIHGPKPYEFIWFGSIDLREDENDKSGPGFLADFGPRRAPGALGRAPARTILQFAPKASPGDKF